MNYIIMLAIFGALMTVSIAYLVITSKKSKLLKKTDTSDIKQVDEIFNHLNNSENFFVEDPSEYVRSERGSPNANSRGISPLNAAINIIIIGMAKLYNLASEEDTTGIEDIISKEVIEIYKNLVKKYKEQGLRRICNIWSVDSVYKMYDIPDGTELYLAQCYISDSLIDRETQEVVNREQHEKFYVKYLITIERTVIDDEQKSERVIIKRVSLGKEVDNER